MNMLEVQRENCKNPAARYSVENIWTNPSASLNHLTNKFARIQGGSFVPASGDDIMEVEQLLAEPQIQKDLIDDISKMSSEGFENCLVVGEFACYAGYSDQKTDLGILDLDTEQAGNAGSKYEFVDSILHEVDGGNLNMPYNIPCVCPNYILDTGLAESSQMDFSSDSGTHPRNLNSECKTEGLERNMSNIDTSDCSHAIIPFPAAKCDQDTTFLENMSIDELHDAFRGMFGRDTHVKDKHWLKRRILFGLENLAEIDHVSSSLLEFDPCSNEQQDELIWMPRSSLPEGLCIPFTKISDSSPLVDGIPENDEYAGQVAHAKHLTEVMKIESGFSSTGEKESAQIPAKRLRKPTRRYIEETYELKTRCCSGKLKAAISSSRGVLIPVPDGVHVRRGRPRKSNNVMGDINIGNKQQTQLSMASIAPRAVSTSQLSDSESQNDVSDDCGSNTRRDKGGARRKHHRQWTLSEVIKLVDGVSQYGVGRWTEIKRLLFSASTYRTSVDLKDKWRNLLRASGAQLHYRKKVEPQKSMSVPIPHSVLRRIRELSVIHPYPRDRTLRRAEGGPAAISTSSTGSRSIKHNEHGVQRLSHT
ncbi:uncharacterized protein LOC109713918 isoform X2 [Ananas comosus]|nr:uncharacterized protein LOC109713918 isoform X2 [Ananas comosus]XP_020093797.1 uncharacterized protein LOC109713918 isoform X2 [Ananas comosus]XP_020093798.1 uncharacterized protein LOC109713918 isoform X2 [Ananas comosus]